ncbi:hypothetical protein ACEWX3_07585 [Mycobacterium sp. G7A2]|uniref:hypothetical protein n=1 Tax=Mycobacterium sp. G7A2 TaxID=3317307 RepID=UPI0035A96ACD
MPTPAKKAPAKTAKPKATLPNPEFAEITFRGHTFVIPRNRDNWSTEGLAYLAEEKYNLFVKYTLEIAKTGQWATLCSLCPRRKDFTQFFVLFGKTIQDECVG